MTATPKLTGSDLRRMRRLADVSQTELARLLGVSQAAVADYERRQPYAETADRYLHALAAIQASREK